VPRAQQPAPCMALPSWASLPRTAATETRSETERRRAEEARQYLAVMYRWGAGVAARRAHRAASGLQDVTRVDEAADMGGGDGRLGAEFGALAGQLAGQDMPEAGWCAVLLALSGAGMTQVSDVVQMWPLADAAMRSIGLGRGPRVDVRTAVERIMVERLVERTDGQEYQRRKRAEAHKRERLSRIAAGRGGWLLRVWSIWTSTDNNPDSNRTVTGQ
jgi:hypothetical protein